MLQLMTWVIGVQLCPQENDEKEQKRNKLTKPLDYKFNVLHSFEPLKIAKKNIETSEAGSII